MNFAGFIGLVSAIAVVYFSVHGAAKDPRLFLDPHAMMIVLGGTTTVALLTFSFKRLAGGAKVVFKKILGNERTDYLGTIRRIVEVADAYRQDPKRALALVQEKGTHPFLQDGVKLLVEFGFSSEEIEKVLTNAVRGKKRRDEDESKVWQTVSRFPPAFGLLGATLGMISLLQTLGEPGAQDRIGPAMAVALVATFYGLVVANLVLIPIAEKLTEVSRSDLVLRSIIKEGVIMVGEKKHPSFIEEYLKSFLSPSQRNVEILGGGNEKPAAVKAA